ncbi:hypothetical protein BVC80_7675g1 [Macleaya cordata]|uniref:Zinc finger protein n=1 Tax=Macleaya cordata TaxID=56857 RepID=A0A200R9F8_MACCD|nr:hypothetical protein BVC80_7675g1 [Macleaya cordata]
MISDTEKNLNMMFLKCQECGSFQWLDEAALESASAVGSSSTPKQCKILGCFECGEKDYWKNNCPWVGAPCRNEDCKGTREVKTSKWESYEGVKYI